MFGKIVNGVLLALLALFYIKNVVDSNNILDAILYNRINFIVLLVILYLASGFVKALGKLFLIVLIGGVLFHGYMYYNAYANSDRQGNAPQEKFDECHGEGTTWYSKLNGRCYH